MTRRAGISLPPAPAPAPAPVLGFITKAPSAPQHKHKRPALIGHHELRSNARAAARKTKRHTPTITDRFVGSAMCRATTIEGGFLRPSPSPRLDIRAFYLRLSSCSTAPAELTLAYHPAIGGAALVLNGRALPPAAPAEVTLRRVDAYAYASADRVVAAEGARFEVLAGEEVVAEGVFFARRRGGEGWRVECRRGPASASVSVAEVMVLAEGGVLMRDKARAAGRGRMRCGATRLEGIPEEATDLGGWGRCECGACGDDGDDDGWEVIEDASDDGVPWKQEEEDEVEMETVRWAMEMGVWAVCLGVGILATARRFRRKRAFW